MMGFLGIDCETGLGEFNHEQAQKFISWLVSKNSRRLSWNQQKLGPMIGNSAPKDPTKFIKESFFKIGLRVEKKMKGKKRLSFHYINPKCWELMMKYIENRKVVRAKEEKKRKINRVLPPVPSIVNSISSLKKWVFDQFTEKENLLVS